MGKYRERKIHSSRQDNRDSKKDWHQLFVEIIRFSAQSEEEFLYFGLRRLLSMSGCKHGFIYLYEEENREFVLKAWPEEAPHVLGLRDRLEMNDLEQLDFYKSALWRETMGKSSRKNPVRINEDRHCSFLLRDKGEVKALLGLVNEEKVFHMEVGETHIVLEMLWAGIQKLRLEKLCGEELERAMGSNISKSQLLSVLSQEIRTSLNGIFGFLTLLKGTRLSDEQQEFLKLIQNASQRLPDFLADIQDVSELDIGQLTVNLRAFDIREELKTIFSFFRMKAQDKDLNIDYHLDERMPKVVKGDPLKIKQILINLLNYVISRSPKGEISFSSELKEENRQEIDVWARVENISAEMVSEISRKLLLPAKELKHTPWREPELEEWNLLLCKKIVESMGGKIWISKEEKASPSICISFKFQKDRVEDKNEERLMALLETKRILLVDRDVENARTLRKDFEKAGCSVETYTTGVEAILAMADPKKESFPIDVMLLNEALEDMRGMDLSAALRTIPRLKKSLCIIMTASGDEKIQEMQKDWDIRCLQKSISGKQLLFFVARSIDEEERAMYLETVTQYNIKQARNHKPEILLVEEDTVNIHFFVKMMDMEGFLCDIANNLEEMQKRIEKNAYNIIFADCQMLLAQGSDVIKRIRDKEKEGHRTACVGMVSEGFKLKDSDLKQLNLDEYIEKPLNIHTVTRFIRNANSRRK